MADYVLSETMRDFLVRRLLEEELDDAIADAFLYTPAFPDVTPDRRDFFDIKLVGDAPRITYTTRERLARAGIDEARALVVGSHRIHGRPAAVAQRATGVRDGRCLDIFATTLDSFLRPNDTPVLIWRGEQITWAYNQDNNCTCVYTGSLETSCMRPRHLARGGYFRIWEDVGELAVIVCPECEKIRARTTVLTDDETGEKFFNRVYGSEASQIRVKSVLRLQDMKDVTRTHRRDDGGYLRVECHGGGYFHVPSMDYFSYCTRCKTLSSYNTPCSGQRTYGENRPCVPSTKCFGVEGVRR